VGGKKAKKVGGIAQVIEHLPSNMEALGPEFKLQYCQKKKKRAVEM
jgi:hypothetical protein